VPGAKQQGHQEVALTLPGNGGEALRNGEAGVVDQHVDVPAACGDGVHSEALGPIDRQVDADRKGFDPMGPGQLGRQGVQAVDPPGGQRQVEAPGGVGAREFGAQARGGAGDQGQASGAHGAVSTGR
jgi:hypothetical protein